jgi:hypothetical protein
MLSMEAYFRLHTSTTSGKLPLKSVKSQTVMVEIEVDLLPPFGSKITFVARELDVEEVVVPLDEKVALKLETVPIVDVAGPIG